MAADLMVQPAKRSGQVLAGPEAALSYPTGGRMPPVPVPPGGWRSWERRHLAGTGMRGVSPRVIARAAVPRCSKANLPPAPPAPP
jgi:hypothetical protein